MADSTEVDSTTVSSTAGGGAPAADNPPPRSSRSPFARGRAAEGPRAKVSDLWPYLFEQRGIMAFIVVLSILGAAASLAQPLLVSGVITSVEAQEPLGVLIWALVGLVVVAGLLNGFQHYLLQRTGEGVVLSSRKRLVGRLLNLPISEFDTRRTGDLVSRVGSDTTLLRAVLTQGLVESVGGSLTFLGALIAMLIIDPVLLGLTVLVVVLAIGLVVGLSGRIRVATTKAQAKVGELTASVERAISSVRTIRAAGATKRELTKVEEDATGAYFMGLEVAKISAFVVPVASICMQVAFITVIGVGGYRVATGATTIAQLVMFILFLFMMIMPLGQALGAISAVSSALGALGRIQEVIDLPSEGENDRDLAPLSGTGPSADPRVPAIEFEDVRFAYATAGEKNADGTPGTKVETPVLHGVSFRVERGKRTALVGPSGAGKSTILALIERFYDVTDGRILMGGEDLRTLDRAEFRSLIGYVEQDAAVLAGTIRDNLLIAKPDASDDECVEVLRSVNLHGVLERNPAGLSAQVGEDGIMLSGGEKQRLAIARALLAACPILLLDESTSSLDGVNEQLMREAIDAVAADRTLLVIAHRLSTVVDSDTIIVLEQGRVAGIGTHSELVQSTPLYKELAKHQLLV